jgi:plastocyanin
MRRSMVVFAPALAALLAIAAGCGDDGERPAGTAPAPGEPPAGAIRVVETDFELDPANPKIERAGTLSFDVVNRGQTVHALKIETPDGDFETPTIDPGQSQTLQAELPAGRYTWYCPVANHRQLGMTGTVTVGGGAGASGARQPESEPEDGATPGGGGGFGY